MSAHHAHIRPEIFLGFDLPKPSPEGLLPQDLRRLVGNLRKTKVNWSQLGPQVAFDQSAYFRKRLYRSREWELLVLCWLPGQKTVVHDHGGSWGGTVVVAGEIFETVFASRGAGRRMETRLERPLPTLGVTIESLSTIHRVENRSNAPAVSLHLYSPPLRVLGSFDVETGVRHSVQIEEGPSVAVGGKPQGARRRSVASSKSRRMKE